MKSRTGGREMSCRGWVAGLLVLGLLWVAASTARADRVSMTRTSGQKSSGGRVDQSVPYLTNGKSSFGAYSVGPKIYSSPIVDDPTAPQARPVYNLIFYGS